MKGMITMDHQLGLLHQLDHQHDLEGTEILMIQMKALYIAMSLVSLVVVMMKVKHIF
jgi:hypothetical protein